MLPQTYHAERLAILSVMPHNTCHNITVTDKGVTTTEAFLNDPDALADAHHAINQIQKALNEWTKQ